MNFDGQRQPNTFYAASVSRGKDSTAMLEAIKILGWPLDAIYAVDIWATDTIPAELPPMVAFKDEWDRKCEERYGIPVTRLCARNKDGTKRSYEQIFYKEVTPARQESRRKEMARGAICHGLRNPDMFAVYGFPVMKGAWCNGYLKRDVLDHVPVPDGKKLVSYIGIAADEAKRVERWSKSTNKAMPLVELGWSESTCYRFAEEVEMLSPTYTDSARDGCWFCHNQNVQSLRMLRKNYPEYWQLLLKWDDDSPATFHPDGRTVHDFDRRFQAEDEKYIEAGDRRFRWDDLNYLQTNIYQFLKEEQ